MNSLPNGFLKQGNWSSPQVLGPILWPLPKNSTDEEVFRLVSSEEGGMTSLVAVRHPFKRLVSVYFQKFLDMGEKELESDREQAKNE